MIYDFLCQLRKRVPGDDVVVSIFLMGPEIRLRIDADLANHHLVYTHSKPATDWAILNEDNQAAFLDLFEDEINAVISEWEVGEA